MKQPEWTGIEKNDFLLEVDQRVRDDLVVDGGDADNNGGWARDTYYGVH